MNRKTNLIISAAIAVLTIVGIFTLFAYGVNQGAEGNAGWNVFDLMFGKKIAVGENGVVCGGLLTAFIFQCIVVIGIFIAGAFGSKLGSLLFVINAGLLVAAGILYLNTINFYGAMVDVSSAAPKMTLGAGPICGAVFTFVPALLAVYGAYKNFKA